MSSILRFLWRFPLAVPSVVALACWSATSKGRITDWLVCTVVVTASVFVRTDWSTVGFHHRRWMIVPLVVAATALIRWPSLPGPVSLVPTPLALIVGWPLLDLAQWEIRVRLRNDVLAVASPLGQVRVCAVQAGPWATNHHVRAPAQRYAIDMIALASGHRAPSRGLPVVAPVDGEVAEVADGRSDAPARGDPRGNFVIVTPDGVPECAVLVAHLLCGSVTVRPGDRVRTGDLLGLVGNSGNSTEPHVHLHAQRVSEGAITGVPMRVDGRLLVRNSVLNGGTGTEVVAGREPAGPAGPAGGGGGGI